MKRRAGGCAGHCVRVSGQRLHRDWSGGMHVGGCVHVLGDMWIVLRGTLSRPARWSHPLWLWLRCVLGHPMGGEVCRYPHVECCGGVSL